VGHGLTPRLSLLTIAVRKDLEVVCISCCQILPCKMLSIRISMPLLDMSDGLPPHPNVVMKLSKLLHLLYEDDVDYFD
jgi:hypothetical protein